MTEALAADYAGFGPYGFRLLDCTTDQWLQTTAVLHTNSIAHQLLAPEVLGIGYEKASFFNEDDLSDMACTPTDGKPTPLIDPRSQESVSYFDDSDTVDSLNSAARTANQGTSGSAAIPAAVHVDVTIISSVDDHSMDDAIRLDATSAATNDPGAALRHPADTTLGLQTPARLSIAASRRSSTGDIHTTRRPTANTETPAAETAQATTMKNRARLKHKRVEKQYRNRLSAQFERLLAVLPSEEFSSSSSNGGVVGEDDKDNGGGGESDEGCCGSGSGQSVATTARVTKAEILEVAARLIGDCSCVKRRGSV